MCSVLETMEAPKMMCCGIRISCSDGLRLNYSNTVLPRTVCNREAAVSWVESRPEFSRTCKRMSIGVISPYPAQVKAIDQNRIGKTYRDNGDISALSLDTWKCFNSYQ
ncbi:uncharacterized protein LOC126676664 isoform X2 [Mercurialis annua]|uniref:uncharacterized protein LOC126676664 isoform X2 n=1 Tax=Mercurialis annua TaxID=3986 RepID=UPI0024ADDA2D|nr:uncharacterized protein LOC126676664 isoform X2 [Mercurialis annua]